MQPNMTSEAAPDHQPEKSESHGQETSSKPPASQHTSLKYSLLGPSLTKAGQDSVDQKKVTTSSDESLVARLTPPS